MVRTASLFSQLLALFPRSEFAELVKKHGSERHAKGFNSWAQFVAMMFCQLGRAESLREICNGLACCLGRLIHLGVERAPKRSTLSYANNHRPAALFEDLLFTALGRFRSQQPLGARKTQFRFKNKLFSLDATVISLSLSLFPWASFRSTKGGVKVHVMLDHDDYLPSYVAISEARHHEITLARTLHAPPRSIIAFDRAYTDYSLFTDWTERGIFFVTRLKKGCRFRVLNERVDQPEPVLLDQTIELDACPGLQLRRVVVWDEANNCEIDLLTNIHHLAATTIGAIYRDRWEIETFFRCIKQNLKIKTFVGTSENALRIQIWTALIALLLLKWAHHLSVARWSLSNLASMLRLNLFTYRDFRVWLDNPFETPPLAPSDEQIEIFTSPLGQLTPPLPTTSLSLA